jgi:Ca-activated chloride channel homolog
MTARIRAGPPPRSGASRKKARAGRWSIAALFLRWPGTDPTEEPMSRVDRLAALPLLLCSALAGCGASADSVKASGIPPGGPSAFPTGSGQPPFSMGAGGSAGSGVVSPQPPPTPANTGDRYTAPGTNPFVITEHDPFSTFAADVDTASYDILRRDVNLDLLPRQESVRLEEYVNFFHYDYPAPAADEAHPFRLSLAAAAQVFDRPTTLFRVGVQATNPPPFQKKPANLVFLVDVSGSMQAPDKLPLVQKTLLFTLDRLDPQDQVSIVTYAGSTGVRLAPTRVSERARIAAVIQDLTAGGSTAGAAGLDLAYQQATGAFIEGGINHVLLCTDGDFNVGPSSTKELVDLIRARRKTGVTLTVLGYGIGNLNDDLMEAVSDAGNGMHGVISSEAQARKYVDERMLSTLVHVARDMKIQVEFNPSLVHAYRLLGFENRAIADTDFRNDVIDAGEIGAGHRVTALYELVMAGDAIPTNPGAPPPQDGAPTTLPHEIAAQDLALVKIRYKQPDAVESAAALETSRSLPADDVSETIGAADPDLQWAVAVAALAEILKNSPYADRTFLPAITRIVEGQKTRDDDRAELAVLLASIRGKLGAR